jgi:type IV pilus assembly protein PilO
MKLGIREILFFIVMLAVLGSAYFFVFSKANDKRKALEADTLAKQRDLDNLHNATSGINDRNHKIAELESAIKFFDGKLPPQRDVDTILQQVAQTSEAAGLATQTVKPSKSETTAHYSEEPIELSLTGSFEGFYQFLLDLEKLPRLTRVTQMKLSKIDERKGQMTAHLTLSIYFVPDTSSGGATAAAQ